ncbi:mast cell tryptase-like [Photinus pyralis]|nr:mast cell tryptase-like [Photinus pyralis]
MMRRICGVIYLWVTVYCNRADAEPARRGLESNGYNGLETILGSDDTKTVAFPWPTVSSSAAAENLPGGYVCAPIGSCTTASNSNEIDIRIITPGSTNPCPRGQTLCATPTGASQCGLRFATNLSNVDGLASPGAFPWQVYLVNQTGYAGSGVLINEYHILTAAHKVYLNGASPEMVGVYLGVHNPQQLTVRHAVHRILLHPNFNPTTLFNDIAILRLSAAITPLPQMLVNSVCLPSQHQVFEGQACWVAGWGQSGYVITNTLQEKRQVQVPIVNYNMCYASMSSESVLGANAKRYLDPVGELCAGGQGSRDACMNDGGAPLTCEVNGRFYVAGLVLWGKGCGVPGIYGVYANVTNYVNWISSAMALLTG